MEGLDDVEYFQFYFDSNVPDLTLFLLVEFMITNWKWRHAEVLLTRRCWPSARGKTFSWLRAQRKIPCESERCVPQQMLWSRIATRAVTYLLSWSRLLHGFVIFSTVCQHPERLQLNYWIEVTEVKSFRWYGVNASPFFWLVVSCYLKYW